MNTGYALIAVGVLALIVGATMPAETTTTHTVCTNGADTCSDDVKMTVEETEENTEKSTTAMGGLILTIAGIVVAKT